MSVYHTYDDPNQNRGFLYLTYDIDQSYRQGNIFDIALWLGQYLDITLW